MKEAEATLLRIPGVTEAQVFAKVLVRCIFPSDSGMISDLQFALQEAQDWIEHETGWKVEMTISAGRPEPMPVDEPDKEDDPGRVFVVAGRIVGNRLLVDNPDILKSVRQRMPNPQEEGE